MFDTELMARSGRRGHGSSDHLKRPPGGSNIAVPDDGERARHCWVKIGAHPSAALLLAWRRTEAGAWEGYVARPIPNGIAITWLPAELVQPLEPIVQAPLPLS